MRPVRVEDLPTSANSSSAFAKANRTLGTATAAVTHNAGMEIGRGRRIRPTQAKTGSRARAASSAVVDWVSTMKASAAT